MSLLRILNYPDNRLRKIAKKVIKINKITRDIVDNMFETMYIKKGIGLAATQVDIHLRIIVIDISESRSKNIVLINPEFIKKSGEIISEEGCLSIPLNENFFIKRYRKITINALDYSGSNFKLDADGLLSVCIQHEMDHLIGKLFIDYLSTLEKERINKKIEKFKNCNYNI